MNLKSPKSMRDEHDLLHEKLAKAIKVEGAIGEASKKVAHILHGHFLEEERIAIPPLGLLPELSKGVITEEMKVAIEMSDELEEKLTIMLDEHKEIISALEELIRVAESVNAPEYKKLAEGIIAHAKQEEELIYPTTILIGKYLKLKLGDKD